jgi:hypothetical protein
LHDNPSELRKAVPILAAHMEQAEAEQRRDQVVMVEVLQSVRLFKEV